MGLEVAVKLNMTGRMQQLEARMGAAALARRKFFPVDAGDIVLLHVIAVVDHAVDPRMRNNIARFENIADCCHFGCFPNYQKM